MTIKKRRRMTSAKCSRATTGLSTSYGRGKYWLIYEKPGGQAKGLQGCSFDCHTELPSEQRSRKRRRLNFMPIAFGHRLSFFCSVGMKSLASYASAASVLKVALYDNPKSKPVSVGCTSIGIFWYCCTAFQSNSSERSALLLTFGFFSQYLPRL